MSTPANPLAPARALGHDGHEQEATHMPEPIQPEPQPHGIIIIPTPEPPVPSASDPLMAPIVQAGKLPKLSETAAKTVFNDIESLVPQDELHDVLDFFADKDDRARRVLALLTEPLGAVTPRSLKKAARMSDMSPLELIEMVRVHRLHVGILRATAHLPQIMEDTAIDAKSSSETCLTCGGEGQVGKDDKRAVCRECRGLGSVRIMGDIENRKLMMEMVGLVRKGGGVIINNSQQVGVGTPQADSFESLIGRASKVIEARAVRVAEEPA